MPSVNSIYDKLCAISNLPKSWQKLYKNKNLIEIDPIIYNTAKTTLPVIWVNELHNEKHYPNQEAYDLALAAKEHGLISGVQIKCGSLEFVSFISSHPYKEYAEHLSHLFLSIGQIATTLHHQLSFLIEKENLSTVKLSQREVDCITLSAEGLKAEEIAHKLQIKRRTIYFHFTNIKNKYNAATIAEATSKALKLNHIDHLTPRNLEGI